MDELTPFDKAALTKPGYEVWARQESSTSSGRCLPYLLIVIYETGEKPRKIIDPRKNNEEILTADNYLEIVDYLREEDYSPVKGRMSAVVDDEDAD